MAEASVSRSISDPAVASIVELFHMVKSLIPPGQRVTKIEPQTKVADALALMSTKRFSQLPVVSGNAVLGVFSYRSLAQALAELGQIDTDFRELPVDEFMEEFVFMQPVDKWESTLVHLERKDGVLVGHRNDLQGILTAWDVLTYLRQIASPFVMLAEIELSLRRIIEASVDDEEFKQCVRNSLSKKYKEDELPESVADMTFNDYVQIVEHGRNWPLFEATFGQGDWLRKNIASRLKEVGELRNDAFHFRRQLEEKDNKALEKQRDWLEMKARSYEGKMQSAAVALVEEEAGGPKGTRSGRKTNRKAFLAACEPAAVEFYTWLLAEAKAQGFTVSWGRKGFAVRTRLPSGMASFAYGFPPDSFDRFDIYLDKRFRLTALEKEAWRREVLATSVFQEGGEYTLSAQVSAGNVARLREAFTLVAGKVKALARYPLPVQATVRGETVTADLLDRGGRVRLAGVEYGSPSGAGKAALGGTNVNGWRFWRYFEEATKEWRLIDELRET